MKTSPQVICGWRLDTLAQANLFTLINLTIDRSIVAAYDRVQEIEEDDVDADSEYELASQYEKLVCEAYKQLPFAVQHTVEASEDNIASCWMKTIYDVYVVVWCYASHPFAPLTKSKFGESFKEIDDKYVKKIRGRVQNLLNVTLENEPSVYIAEDTAQTKWSQ